MKELEEVLGFENKMMESVLADLNIGWWKFDFENQVLAISKNIGEQLGLKEQCIPLSLFVEMIRGDFRERIVNGLKHIGGLYNYDNIFPLICANGEVWVHFKFIKSELGDKEHSGSIQIISNFGESEEKNAVQLRTDNLLNKLNSISHTLLSFLHTNDRAGVVNKVLKDILVLFKAGRGYIIEYDWDNMTQSCTYEVTDDDVKAEQELITNLPVSTTPWWTEQIRSGKPIIISSIDELPEEASWEKDFLALQQVKSLFVVPLFSRNGVWGYAGLDIVEESHRWSVEDIRWLTSLFNIVSICIELQRSEVEAEKERDYLHDLYLHMPIGHISLKPLYDEDNNLVDYVVQGGNKAFENIAGYRDRDYVGGKGSDIYDDYKDHLTGINGVLGSNDHVVQTHFFEKTGRYSNVLSYSTHADRVICFLSDVTEIYETNKVLDQKEKLLRNIFDNLPAGIELYDNKGDLLDLNIKDLEMFGLECKEDVHGKNLFENPNISQEIRDEILSQKQTSFNLSYSFNILGDYFKSSRTGTMDINTTVSMLYDVQGALINYLLISIDETEINNAYKKNVEFERLFSLVSKFGKIGYCKFDLHSRTGYAVSQWYQNLCEDEKTPLSDIIGYYKTVYKEDRDIMLKYLNQLEQNEINHFSIDLRVITPEGVSWIRANVIKNMTSENPEIISINYDITELKEAESKLIKAKNHAEESDRLKSAFLANMSHEIRTPLNSIIGFSELLSSSNDIIERAEYMKIVHENNNLLLQLISDILDLSKIEAETLEFSYTNIYANQLCNEIIYSLNIEKHQVEVVFEQPLTDCCLVGDANRLKQVISNFISNALKFTKEGEITLGYHLIDEDKIKFYVQDTGFGIAQDQLENVFERFVKLNPFIQGTGLGLSICRSIIDQFKGTIGVDSEVGKGACFWFVLPINCS